MENSVHYTDNRFTGKVSYTQVKAQPNYGYDRDRDIIQTSGKIRLDDNWALFGAINYDLNNKFSSERRIGVLYQDECTSLPSATRMRVTSAPCARRQMTGRSMPASPSAHSATSASARLRKTGTRPILAGSQTTTDSLDLTKQRRDFPAVFICSDTSTGCGARYDVIDRLPLRSRFCRRYRRSGCDGRLRW